MTNITTGQQILETIDNCLRVQCKLQLDNNSQQQPTSNIGNQIMYLQEWITQIYFEQAKIQELFLKYGGLDVNLAPASISKIIRKVQKQVCENQLTLINHSIDLIYEAMKNTHYYKIDAQGEPVSFSNIDHENRDYLQEMGSNATILYQYCVLIIYQHYCSITQSNKQVCMLAQIIRQNTQANNFTYRSKDHDNGCQKQQENIMKSIFRDLFRDINPEQIVKQQQLNMICLGYFLPILIPALQNKPHTLAYLLERNVTTDDQDTFSIENDNELYNILENLDIEGIRNQLNRIQKFLFGIIYKGKQNTRKYCSFLEEFEQALRLIKKKLYRYSRDKIQLKTPKEHYFQNQFPALKPLRSKQKPFNFTIEEQEDFHKAKAELEKQINKQRYLFESAEYLTKKLANPQTQSKLELYKKNNQICEEVNLTIMDKLENNVFLGAQRERQRERSGRYPNNLADAQAYFKERKVFKGTQSFQFKTKALQQMKNSKKQCSKIQSQISKLQKTFQDLSNPLQRILSKQDNKIHDLLHSKSLVTQIFQNEQQNNLSEQDRHLMRMRQFNIEINHRKNRLQARQSQLKLKRNLVKRQAEFPKDLSIQRIEKLITIKQREIENKRKNHDKNEIVLKYNNDADDGINNQKLREFLVMGHQFLEQEDYGMEDDEEEKEKETKRKRKRNRRKKKKNNGEQPPSQNIQEKSQKLEASTQQILSQAQKLTKTQSLQQKIHLISPDKKPIKQETNLSHSTIDTIKFLLNTKIKKQNRIQCYRIDKGTFDRWHRECENGGFVIGEENGKPKKSKTKAKNKRMKSNGRI